MVTLRLKNSRFLCSSLKITGQVIILLGLVFSLFLSPENQVQARPLQAAVPDVALSAPANPFIGDAITITADFSNDGADTGYGPYIDLFLPLSGADGTTDGSDDGISFNNASYLGESLTTNVLNCPAGTSVTHPLTGLTVFCPAQPVGLFSPFIWQMVVITMPFGSFVPGQPDATVSISAQLSNLADLGTPLPIQVRSGFMFGHDPLDNPGVDPVIQSGLTTVDPDPTPSLITLDKTYSGPEDETATGPNYPREYTVTATIASGQTVTDLTLTDILPNNMQYIQMVNPTSGCSVLPSTTTPGGTITCNLGTVTGSTSMTFRYYIPLNDISGSAVINAGIGNDVLSQNTAYATGSWQPLDGRDLLTLVTVDAAGYEHILTDKSIAIQKGVDNITGAPNNPGDVLRYTLNFQVSDYFAFDEINITDVLSDGQHLLLGDSYDPQLSINGNQYTLSTAPLDDNHVDVDCNYTGGPGSECDWDNNLAANDGGTTIVFNVSEEISSRSGGDANGRMVGGCVPPAGVGAGNYPDCTSHNDGATTGTITFYTQILEEFTDAYLPPNSNDPSVDQGDVLENSVTIDGRVLTVQDANTPTESYEADTSGASVNIPYGVITKSIYAINFSTSFASPVSISPGDRVTYRVTYTLPTSDFEDLVFTDYLPLPVFTAGEVNTFSNTVCGIPVAGASCLGPGDSYHSLHGAVNPVLSTTAAGNSIIWTYGDYDHTSNPSSMIDLLFTVTVNNQPFADGLYLTNQAHVQEGSTNAGSREADGIVQILLQEPYVTISKGAVWTNKASAVFSPETVGPVAFSNSCPSFSGTINSTNLAANPINSNLAGVDAGDTVRMAVVIENTGRNAAYDVRAHDALPAGMTFVLGSVCVTNGAGAPLPYFGNANDFVTSGITLTSLDKGKLSDGSAVDTGANIAIITYNVTIDASSEALHTYTNTATLENYAGQPGGPNHIPGGRTDSATVTLAPFAAEKTLIDTNQTFTTDNNVAIGEIVTYRVTVTIPEGTTSDVIITDTLPAGMAFVDCLAVSASAGVTSSIGAWANACNDNTNPVITNDGTISTWSLGTITNNNNDSALEQVQLEYTAVVLNAGVRGNTRQNNVSAAYTGNGSTQTTTAAGPIVTIVEPTLRIEKAVAPTTADAGDSVEYSVLINHAAASNAYAFNAHVRDDLSTLPLTLGSFSSVTFSGTTCGTPTVTNASTDNVIDLTIDVLPTGCSASFTYTATLTMDASALQAITNTANIDWSSLPGNVSGQTSYEGTPSLDCERTGNTADCGGAVNNYRTSDPATVTVSTTPVKSLVTTSEGHTSGAQLAIGEIARYRLQMVWPEGTTINAMFRDNVVNNLQFLNDGTAKIAFVSNSGDCSASPSSSMSSSTLGTAPWVCGNDTNIGNITPTYVLPDNAVSSSSTTNTDTYASGTDAYFKFGTLTNSDSDLDAEYVVVELNALVLNNNYNQSGQNRNNTFNLMTGETPAVVGSTSNVITITIAEPVVVITKSLVTAPVDAGDPVVYDMFITNTGGTNGATAFDLEMTDTLDTNLTNISAAIQATTQGTPCADGTAFTATPSVSGQLVTMNATCLDPSQSITVRVSANVVDTAPSSLTIPNIARVAWTSLPGLTGTPGASNPTGSTTPGGTGTRTGERNGTGDTLNDYHMSVSVDAPLANPISVVKNAPVPIVYTIGQTITYPIVVRLPEGTTRNLRVTDTLPQGLAYGSMAVDATSFAGSVDVTPTVATEGDPALENSTTTFTFGDTVVNATAGSGSSSFTLNITARVMDILQNQIEDTKTNTASAIYFDPDGGGSDVTMPGSSQTITIAEPRIVTTKDVSPSSDVEAGDVVTYTVQFTNNGTSTAFDVTAHDVLAQGVDYMEGSATCVDQASTNVLVSVTNNGTTLEFDGIPAGSWDIAAGNSITCTYQLKAGSDLFLDGSHTNTIDADWSSLNGTAANERVYDDSVTSVVDGSQDTDVASFTAPGINFSKTVDKTTATIGEVVTYTLNITGPNGLIKNLVVADTLDSGWIYNNDAAITGLSVIPTLTISSPNDGTAAVNVSWTFGNAEKTSEPATITYSVTIANETATTTGDILGNSATLNYNRADDTPAAALTDSTTTDVIEPDLAITKSLVTPPSNSVGSLVSYNLLVGHTADSTADAYDVVISDIVPSTYLDFTASDNTALTVTFTPAACATYTNNSTPVTDTVNIAIPHLPQGCQASVNFTTVLKQEITPGLLVTNTAYVDYSTLSGSPDEERTYLENNGASFTTRNPDVEKVLTSSSLADTTDPALTIGEVATFTITVHVPEGTTNTLQVIDDLPLGMAYVDGSAVVDTTTDRTATAIPAPTISTSGANGGTVTFDFTGPIVIMDADPLTEDDTFEITLQATLLNDVNNQTGGKLDNQVTVQADGGATLSDSATISIVEPDLNLTKSVDDTTPEPEQEITYTLDLAHTAISTSDAYDVVIVDTLPSGLVFVAGSATTPVGWSFSYDGTANTVTFTGDLPLLTANAKFTYRAVINGATVPVSSTLTNIAKVDWTSLPGTGAEERNGTDGSGGTLNDYHDEAQQTVTFYGVELVITKADSPTSIVPSTPTTPSVLRYTISYSNTGNLDATNVVITETVPQYTTFNKLTSTGGDTLPPTGWSCADGAAAGTSCKFIFATLPAGASGTLNFDVLLDETVPANTTQILNTVTIAADEKEPIDANNTDNEDTPLDALPDMAVVKTDGVSVVASGVELTYTLTVRNNGSEGATGVVITDTLPVHVTYVTGSASPAYTSMDTTPPANPGDPDVVTLTWEISGEWAAGTERTFTYRVMVEDPMPTGVSELVNVAEVEDDGSNGTDPTPADNISTDTDYLATLPNTNLSKIIASTSEDSTELLNVAIGESLLYRITFVLPPGDLPGMTLSDAMPQGLAFGECMSITSSSSLVTTSLVDGFDTTCSTPVITAEPAISLEPVDQGRNVVFNFGDVTNGGTENATLTLDYTVYVLDNADNIRDLELINLVNWRWGTNNDVQTQSEPVKIVEPTLSIGKVVRPMSGLPGTVVTYTLTVAHTPESNATAFDVLVEDILPIEMTYLPGTLQVISGPVPDLLEEAGTPVLQIGWNELPARDVNNNPVNVVIEYQAQINKQAKQGDVLVNQALVEWTSLPEDLSTPQTPNNPLSTERYYDPGDAVNNYGAIASAEFSVPIAPETGFAPGVVTDLSGRLRVKANDNPGNLSLDIPAIGVNLPIVGIPPNKDGWDLTWLGAQAGWLEGTAYPTWEGNTVITAHVYLPNGKPGPFIDLNKLRWGSRFYILSNGMRYTYEVRIVARVKPEDNIILAHEDRDWVTLVTCAGYDEAIGTYKWRDIVKAVLIKVGEE